MTTRRQHGGTRARSARVAPNRMPTIRQMQVGAEDLMRGVLIQWGRQIDEAVVRRQAARMVRVLRPRFRRAWHAPRVSGLPAEDRGE